MNLPVYNDGKFKLYKLISDNGIYEKESLADQQLSICFKDEGINEFLKNELSQAKVEVSAKITIPQYKTITNKHVVEIDGIKHKIYNVNHFINKDGYKETKLTLEVYHE